jgi:hypothetical protein
MRRITQWYRKQSSPNSQKSDDYNATGAPVTSVWPPLPSNTTGEIVKYNRELNLECDDLERKDEPPKDIKIGACLFLGSGK